VQRIDDLTRAKAARNLSLFRASDLADLEACYLKILRNDLRSNLERGPVIRDLPLSRELVQRVPKNALLSRYVRYLVYGAQFGTFLTVVAAAVLLQIHTGWNFSSVLALEQDCIKRIDGNVEIQSFKERTSDFTPISLVTAKDTHALMAIEFLETRLDEMKRFGLVLPSEKRLWLNANRARFKRPEGFHGWGDALKKLQTKHDLPLFSFEQLRVQVLAAAATARGGLEAARHMAGHASISTTAHYLDQLILHRLNSSINLEFQARLERSAEIRMSDDWTPGMRSSEDLLYAIGDGSSCQNPYEPPDATQLQGGICSAKRCHAEGGCANRRLVIDADRIEEALRTSRFYEENWKRLLLENEGSFNQVHLPSFLFNIALLGVVERSPYRHVVRKIRERVDAEDERR
jgi:hypothetical protein